MTTNAAETTTAFLALLHESGSVIEVRIPDTPKRTVSGYFDGHAKLATAVRDWDGKANIYVTLNPCDPALLARCTNRLQPFAKQTTSDHEIRARWWLVVDIDPVRPAGICASDEEQRNAGDRANQVFSWLKAEGWPAPVAAGTGNGCYLLYRIDLPNDDTSRNLIERCLKALAFRFDDEDVKIDTGMFNAARVIRLIGTVNCKGDSTADRPHRRSYLRSVPREVRAVSTAQLHALVAMCPPDAVREMPAPKRGHTFDIDDWIASHALEIGAPRRWNGGRKWVFSVCPWNQAHRNGSAFILQSASGAIAAGCLHNGCRGRVWHDLRDLVEPGWRERREGIIPPGYSSSIATLLPRPTSNVVTSDSLTKLVSVKELLAEPEEAIQWVVDGVMPAGGFSIIVGKPKTGKSTLTRTMGLAVARGEQFLGRETSKGPVVYFALEEKRAELRRAFRLLGAQDEEILMHIAPAPLDALRMAREVVAREKPRLLIVDPLYRFVRVGDVNDYAKVTAALEPLLALARGTETHVCAVHHSPKTAVGGIDAALGSTALGGTVDTMIVLRRNEDRTRLISSVQRYGADLEESLLDFDLNTGAVSIGATRHDHDLASLQQAILALLREKRAPQTEHDIEAGVEGRTAAKREALRKLVATGEVVRTGTGRKGDAFRYSLPDSRSLVPGICWEQENENFPSRATPLDISGIEQQILVPETRQNSQSSGTRDQKDGSERIDLPNQDAPEPDDALPDDLDGIPNEACEKNQS